MGCHQGGTGRIGSTGGRCVGTCGAAIAGGVAEPQEALPRCQLIVTGPCQTSTAMLAVARITPPHQLHAFLMVLELMSLLQEFALGTVNG